MREGQDSIFSLATHTGEVGIEDLQILQGCKGKEVTKVFLQPLLTTCTGGDTVRICKEDKDVGSVPPLVTTKALPNRS